MNCSFTKSDGSLCNAKSIKNSQYCFQHTKASKKEEINDIKLNDDFPKKLIINLPDLNIENVHDLPQFLIDTVKNVRGHVLDAKIGSVIGYLINILLRSYEVSDLQTRIEKIEQLISNSFVEIKDLKNDPEC